ncbi:MAG: YkgJ family cysteine cluster protein [Mangrovibacterium sp.]
MTDKVLSEHEQAFYNDGFRLGVEASKVRNNEKKFLDYVRTMLKSIDELIGMLEQHANRQGINIDCKKGCGYCCHQAVYANSYEFHLLSNFMQKKFSSQQREDVRIAAVQKFNHTENLNETDVLNYKEACPLLINDACSAYPARPMACRIYLSTKLESCIKFYNEPQKKDSIPQLLEFPLSAGRMMNEGFTAALRENGIEIAELRLEEGLKTVLTHGVH